MHSAPFDPAHLTKSVFAVPPLARDASGSISVEQNRKIIEFLESGGIRSILYGGNAVFYHIRGSEYASALSLIADQSGDETVVVPAIGSAYGFARDQIDVLKDFDFGTAMLLPTRDVADQAGIARGIGALAEAWGKPLVLYLKIDRWLEPEWIRSLESDGVISWIKYAVVRDDPAEDEYLRQVLDVFPAERIVSGIGEQPAIIHLRDFGLAGFTSGCVCVAPERSMAMLHAIQNQDWELAESIRQWFLPLEDLRNQINPIRVLHHAVSLAGIAETGPLLPLISDLSAEQQAPISAAVSQIMAERANT